MNKQSPPPTSGASRASGTPRHFLDLDQIDAATLHRILDLSDAIKRDGNAAALGTDRPLAGRTLVLIFEKNSTRTRVSFEVAMRQLGGDVIVLEGDKSQLGRGETIADTARVLSRYADAIMIRTSAPEKLAEMAKHATVPVINGLTDAAHPCQLMADVMTLREHKGADLRNRVVTWSGDGNNVAQSWIKAAARFGFEMRVASPDVLRADRTVVDWALANGGRIVEGADPEQLASGADCVVTDTWVSMGDKDAANRHNLLRPYQVNEDLMSRAKPDAVFMHCLPAHRGEEVTDGVIDGPRSVVWDEAENRLHAQKGVLAWSLLG
ncbi:ornithine carbamoyltransferase [Roseospira navarrensis]|uniref:Ornithine carbamoyltransferase n=1 Tax=Roseospira navarrensis TaxID=140058 RepID=A0A7X1ZDM4_9PROT|nr:ornithine carbamoyltransferase [Roseospira navarrensis]MQX36620.1 ornithine carbamoyltransferase [Roseospira navarrensis]